eukprot:5746353-Alexandrium_andersonii.AAC.1
MACHGSAARAAARFRAALPWQAIARGARPEAHRGESRATSDQMVIRAPRTLPLMEAASTRKSGAPKEVTNQR